MEQFKHMLESLTQRLANLAKSRTVVGQPIGDEASVAIPLCELSLGFSAGKAGLANTDVSTNKGKGGGTGNLGGLGGGFSVKPVAVLIVDKHGPRLEAPKRTKKG